MERDEFGRFIKGHKQLNTGKTWIRSGEKKRLGAKHTDESKKKMSMAKVGKMPPNIEYLKNYERPRGAESHMWRGGRVDESKVWRGRIEYKIWRTAVYTRDKWVCQKCGVLGGRLHPHHMKSFKEFPELRFAIDNGITLCVACHKEFHKVYGRRNINKEQVNEFIQNNQ